MLEKSQAIVLKSFPYKESSSIVVLYTQTSGLKSYIIKGGRSKKASIRSSLFQPLQLLDIVAYNNPKNTLNTIKECKINTVLMSIYSNQIKISLVFFIAELLNLSLKEDNPNDEIFDFLKQSVILLEEENERQLKDFHIYFMYRFSLLSGFQPMNNYSKADRFFDISAGKFVANPDIQTLSEDSSLLLHSYLDFFDDVYVPFTVTSLQRNDLLSTFVLFFEHHITSSKQIKSLRILHDLF